jgi:hypothetical protein
MGSSNLEVVMVDKESPPASLKYLDHERAPSNGRAVKEVVSSR